MSGHYHPDLEEVESKCSSCGNAPTHRVPNTEYRWCCMCGAMHRDRQQGVVSGGCFPPGLALMKVFREALGIQEKAERKCPICLGDPMAEIWPFCSAECLHADPSEAKDPDMLRRVAQFEGRDSGAGGPGGMTVTKPNPTRLAWYLAGAQDEWAVQHGVDWGQPVSDVDPEERN